MSEGDINKLVQAAMSIGAIAECNCHYTAGLARKIAATGKTVGDLTVSELMNLDVDYGMEYNGMLDQVQHSDNSGIDGNHVIGDSHLQTDMDV